MSEGETSATHEDSPLSGRGRWIIAAVIVGAIGLTYRGALPAPQFFDDAAAKAWPVAPWARELTGSHAMNIALHIASALLLLGVVGRTLRAPALRARFAAAADGLAGAIALIWALHPLQSQAVVTLAGRAELLAGCFCLLTFYAYLRGTTSESPGRWHALAIGASALGMASNAAMAATPLLVFLHDTLLVAGGWREAAKTRGWLHAGLVATWLIFAVVARQTGDHGSLAGVAGWAYALTQCGATVHYLALSVWPNPLVMDYGPNVVTSLADVRWQMMALIGLAGATLWALRRRTPAGFLGAWFGLILAAGAWDERLAQQTMAEPRMYLPLAAVIALLVVAGYGVTGRRSPGLWLALPMVFVAATRARVADYESELRIWGDTVLKRPFNARAHVKLGDAWRAADKLPEAITQYEVALKLRPTQPETLTALASALLAANRIDEAIGCAAEAVRAAPGYAEARSTLGDVLARAGRTAAAVAEYRAALRLEPGRADTHYRLAEALAALKHTPEATAECEAALRLDPTHAAAKALLERLRKQG